MASLAENGHRETSPRIMKERAARNPLLAEKTPRTVYQTKKWSYDPPKGQPVPEKWNYPTEEVGLVSQLGSMAERVKKEKAREMEYQERIKQHEESQKLKEMMSSRTSRTARDENQYTDRIPGESARDTARGTGRESARDSTRIDSSRDQISSRSQQFDTNRVSMTSSRGYLEPIQEKTLLEYPISSMKSLQSSHPEILSKVRAERAVKYIEKLTNPLDPPEYSHVSARVPFRPGGGTINHNHTRQLPGKRGGEGKRGGGGTASSGGDDLTQDIDTARMKESLKTLVKALEETDSEIARQDLKIALAKKVKTFEKKGSRGKTDR